MWPWRQWGRRGWGGNRNHQLTSTLFPLLSSQDDRTIDEEPKVGWAGEHDPILILGDELKKGKTRDQSEGSDKCSGKAGEEEGASAPPDPSICSATLCLLCSCRQNSLVTFGAPRLQLPPRLCQALPHVRAFTLLFPPVHINSKSPPQRPCWLCRLQHQ